jgi:NAD-dependent dihydropyrimidine dehydrogenase PreA subunit
MKSAIKLEAPLNIRNAATLAGTLVACDGRSTFAATLLALDAKLEIKRINPFQLVEMETESRPPQAETETFSTGEFLPLRAERMRLSFDPRQLGHEWRVRSSRLSLWERIKYFARMALLNLAGAYLFARRLDTKTVRWSRYIDDLVDGLSNYLDSKGFASVGEIVGKAVPSVTDWQYLNLNHVDKAYIDQDLCIQCGRCHIVCEDTSHQAITATRNGARHFEVIDAECVGCNLCVSVCPVVDCITMRPMTSGVDPRTNRPITSVKADWTTHPNNPGRKRA